MPEEAGPTDDRGTTGHHVTDGSSDAFPVDTTVPQSARVWNCWTGGKDNYAVDREAGEQIRKMNAHIAAIARAPREFRVRSVTHLTRGAAIRQFLDIGTRLPTANNTHEVAQSIAPESRIVYVDHYPLVRAHA